MRPALQKALAWIGLAIGAGGTLLTVWVFILYGWPEGPDRVLWYGLAGSVLLIGVCVLVLRRAYRMEPVPGRAQLALVDLISALLIFGSVLYIGSYAMEGAELLAYWFMPALIVSLCYLAGVTRAARLGLCGWPRYVVGTATAFTMVGCLGMGTLIFLSALLARSVVDLDRCKELVLTILGLGMEWDTERWLIHTFRVSLCALPLGLLLGLLLRLALRPGRGAAEDGSGEDTKGDR